MLHHSVALHAARRERRGEIGAFRASASAHLRDPHFERREDDARGCDAIASWRSCFLLSGRPVSTAAGISRQREHWVLISRPASFSSKRQVRHDVEPGKDNKILKWGSLSGYSLFSILSHPSCIDIYYTRRGTVLKLVRNCFSDAIAWRFVTQ